MKVLLTSYVPMMVRIAQTAVVALNLQVHAMYAHCNKLFFFFFTSCYERLGSHLVYLLSDHECGQLYCFDHSDTV